MKFSAGERVLIQNICTKSACYLNILCRFSQFILIMLFLLILLMLQLLVIALQ